MVGQLLLRGMIVGVLAALLAFGFAKVFGEPSVDWAITFESQMEAANHAASDAATATAAHSHGVDEEEIFSRATQSGVGLFTGLAVYGTALGGLFALVFAFAHGRIGRLGPRGTAAVLAALGFVAVILVPGLKYPANPPSVGHPDTIMLRTQLYFGIIAFSIAAMVLAVWLAGRLRTGWGAWNAVILAGLAFLALVTVVALVLPPMNEVPEGFSAAVMWQFRMAAWGIQLVLWAGIGLGFGAVAERYLRAQGRSHSAGNMATR